MHTELLVSAVSAAALLVLTLILAALGLAYEAAVFGFLGGSQVVISISHARLETATTVLQERADVIAEQSKLLDDMFEAIQHRDQIISKCMRKFNDGSWS